MSCECVLTTKTSFCPVEHPFTSLVMACARDGVLWREHLFGRAATVATFR